MKKTSALKQGEVADDCCSTEPSEDPDQTLVEKVTIPVSDTAKKRSSEKDNGSQAKRSG